MFVDLVAKLADHQLCMLVAKTENSIKYCVDEP